MRPLSIERRLIPRLDREGFLGSMRACGWPIVAARPEEVDAGLSFGLVFEVTPDITVTWVENRSAQNVPYLEIESAVAVTEANRAAIREAGDCFTDTELRSLLESAPDAPPAQAAAMLAIAVGAPRDRDTDYESCLARGLEHRAPLVRRATLNGLWFVSWVNPELVRLRLDDDDPAARELARQWLSGMKYKG